MTSDERQDPALTLMRRLRFWVSAVFGVVTALAAVFWFVVGFVGPPDRDRALGFSVLFGAMAVLSLTSAYIARRHRST